MASSIIGSSDAADYADIATWEAAVQGTTDSEEYCILEDEEHQPGAAAVCRVGGWSNPASVHVFIQGVNTQDGDPTTTPLINNRGSRNLRFEYNAPHYSTVRDLSFYDDNTSYYSQIEYTAALSKYDLVERCTFSGFHSDRGDKGVYNRRSGEAMVIDSCLFVDCDDGIYLQDGGYNISVSAIGCTFYDSNILLDSGNAAGSTEFQAIGCLFKGVGPNRGGSDMVILNGAGTYGLSSIDCIHASAGAWTYVSNITSGVTFNDSGAPSTGEVSFNDVSNNDWSLYDSTDNLAVNYVTNATLGSTDVINVSRGTSPFDAGAFSLVSAGGDFPPESGGVALPLTFAYRININD
jgi:hypothetical protein